MAALSDEQWQAPVLTAQGRTVPATEVPWRRAREVYVHGWTCDRAFLRGTAPCFRIALCDDVVAKRASAQAAGPALSWRLLTRRPLGAAGGRRDGRGARPTRRGQRVPDRAGAQADHGGRSAGAGPGAVAMRNRDVIVVGGGIGGLSAAFALARKGSRVRVLERAKEFGEVGAGIQIAPNCTRILHEYGLLDEAKASACCRPTW